MKYNTNINHCFLICIVVEPVPIYEMWKVFYDWYYYEVEYICLDLYHL